MYAPTQHLHPCVSLSKFFEKFKVDAVTAVGGHVVYCVDNCPNPCDFNAGELLRSASNALAEATRDIETVLGYSLCPKQEQETVRYPRQECGNMIQAKTGKHKSVKVINNHYLTAGKIKSDYVGTADVYYFDRDNDGYHETAELIISTTTPLEYPLEQLCVYFDGYNDNPQYAIDSNQRAELTANGVKLTFNSIDLITPQSFSPNSPFAVNHQINLCCCFDENGKPKTAKNDINSANNGCNGECPYASKLTVYRRYIDKQCDNADLIYHKALNVCGCGSCSVCVKSCVPACVIDVPNMCNHLRVIPVVVKESDDGRTCHCVQCPCPTFGEPDEVCIHYIGGTPDTNICDGVNKKVNAGLLDAVYYLAAARMELPYCVKCGCSVGFIERQQEIQEMRNNEPIDSTLLIDRTAWKMRGDDRFNTIVGSGRRGEFRAWSIVSQWVGKGCK